MLKIIAVLAVVLIAFLYIQNTAGSTKTAKENKQLGIDFLAANKETEGVQTTPSGLQYLVINKGAGTQHPKRKDTVTVHYHGTLIDGTVFDSSVERDESISFPLNRVIKGWTEGLQLMVVGDKFRLVIPSELAYGKRKTGAIPKNSTLIFDVELLGIND